MNILKYISSRKEDFVLIIGLLLRCLLINEHPLWFDENVSIILASEPLDELLRAAAVDNHPPLYFIFIKAWLFFINDPLLIRISSVIIGTFTLWVIYRFISKMANSKIALLILALVSLSPLHIYYSTELRMYELLTLEGILIIWSLYAYLHKKHIKWIIWYIFLSAIALYTHYFAAIFLVSVGLVILIYRRELFLKWLISTSIAVLFFLPWFFYTLQFSKPNCWCWPSLSGTLGAIASYTVGLMGHFDVFDAVFTTRIPPIIKAVYFINAGYFFGLYLLSWYKHRLSFFYPMQILLWFPFILLTIINLKLHIFSPRSFIIFSPFYYLSIADFLSYTPSKKYFGLTILACILLLFITGANAIYARDL